MMVTYVTLQRYRCLYACGDPCYDLTACVVEPERGLLECDSTCHTMMATAYAVAVALPYSLWVTTQ